MNEVGPIHPASSASAAFGATQYPLAQPPRRRRRRLREPGETGWPMRLYLYAVLIFFSGALTRPLSGNANSFVDSGESPIIQYFGIMLYAVALPIAAHIVFEGMRRRRLPAPIMWCAIAVALWIAASVLWSADPTISTRRAIAYTGSLMIVITLALAIPAREVIRAFVFLAVTLIAVTAALYVVAPTYALHQAGELGVAEHAGRLRGSFGHKNEFARVAAVGVMMLWLFGRSVLRSRILWLGAMGLGAVLLLLAGSAKIVIAFPVAIVSALLLRLRMAPAYRYIILLFAVAPLALLYTSGALDAVAGDLVLATGRTGLSGRDEIWAAAWSSISNHPILGQGYYAGWAAEAQQTLQILKYGVTIGHAHNGFFETLLDVGGIGLALALIPLVYLALRAIALSPGQVERLQALAVMWIVMDLTLNFAGSYLINYNDLYPTMTLLLCLWFVRLDRGTIDERSLALLSAPPAPVRRRHRFAGDPLSARDPRGAYPSAGV